MVFEYKTVNIKYVLNLKSNTLNLKSSILNLKSSILNYSILILNLKSSILNYSILTLNSNNTKRILLNKFISFSKNLK